MGPCVPVDLEPSHSWFVGEDTSGEVSVLEFEVRGIQPYHYLIFFQRLWLSSIALDPIRVAHIIPNSEELFVIIVGRN